MSSSKNDAKTSGFSPAQVSPSQLDQALKIMKLTTEEEMSMFRRVRAWMEGRSFSHIQLNPLVGAAVLSRFLLTSDTKSDVEPTCIHNKITTQKQQEDHRTPGTPSEASEPSSVTPDETIESMDVDDANKAGIVVKPSSHESNGSHVSENDNGHVAINTNPTQPPKNEAQREKLEKLVTRPNYSYMAGIATDLATLLSMTKEKQNGSPPPIMVSTPTVAYIASAFLTLFKNKDDETPSYHAADVYRTVINKEASTADIIKAATFLQKSLQSLARSAKSSVESYSDFEYLWSSCAVDASFRTLIMKSGEDDDGKEKSFDTNSNDKHTAVSSSEEVFGSMKQRSWKLSCLAANLGGEQNGRHGRILTSAVCLGLLSSLPQVGDKNDEPPTKKARTMEEDAIAALSMMVKEKYSVETTIKVIVASANSLISSLRGASMLPCEFVSCDELEKAVVVLVKHLSRNEKEVESTDDEKKPFENGEDNESFVASELHSLLPTRAERKRLIDMATIDNMLSAQVKQALQGTTGSFDGFPFVDEPRLVSSQSNLVPHLCMASSKANSSGVALTFEYDGLMKSQEGQAAAAMAALMAGSSTVSPPDRGMREVMELNEWTVSVLSISDIRPSTRLMLYLEASDDDSIKRRRKRPDGVMEEITVGGGWRSVIAPVLNRIIGRMIEGTPNPGEDAPASHRLTVLEESGAVVLHGDDDDVEIKLCQALIALYYQSLESLLYHETARVKSASHPKLLLSETFHRALLTCCCICLMKGLCSSSALALSEKYLDLDFPCIQQIMESCPYTYLKVSESFARALKLDKPRGKLRTPYVLGLPRILQQQLSQCEVLVIDSLLWSQDTRYARDISVMDVIRDIKSIPDQKFTMPAWPPEVLQPILPEEIDDCKDKPEWANRKAPAMKLSGAAPPDHLYLSYIIRKLLKIAFFRISAFCNALSIPPEYPVASQVWIAFRYLLRHHIELLYDRHVDQLILCTLYGVCKIMKFQPEPTFSRIIEIYTQVRGSELGDRACHRLVRRIRLIPDVVSPSYGSFPRRSSEMKGKKQYGNVIHLYNDIFVPAMKGHLLQSKSLKKSIVTLHVQMLQGRRRNTTRTVKDNEIMAARAEKLAHDSGNWANPEPTAIAIKAGNVKLNILLPASDGLYAGNSKRKSKAKSASSFSFNPENRAFYSFGDASGGNIALMNRMAAEV